MREVEKVLKKKNSIGVITLSACSNLQAPKVKNLNLLLDTFCGQFVDARLVKINGKQSDPVRQAC